MYIYSNEIMQVTEILKTKEEMDSGKQKLIDLLEI